MGSFEKWEVEVSIKKGSAFQSIKHNQFLLTLAWASTIQEVQSLNLEQVATDFDLQNHKLFGPEQIYTAPSRVKTYDNLYRTGESKNLQ